MARSKQQIKNSITTAFMASETLSGIYGFAVGASFEATFSLVSLENILFELISFAIMLHEQMHDAHTAEVDNKILTQKNGRLPWWRAMALKYQHGYNLVPDMDYYDNTALTDDEIAQSQIIKYAAANEAAQSKTVILKISGADGPVSDEEKEGFAAYVEEWRPAGVSANIINYLPDKLYLNIRVKRDAQVLSSTGMSIAEGNYPVNEAIQEYLTELPFNGELKLSALIDKIQLVPGVLDATVMSAQTAWIDPNINDYAAPVALIISKIPESGRFEVVTFDNITYVV